MRTPGRVLDFGCRASSSTFGPVLRTSQILTPKRQRSSRALQASPSRPSLSDGSNNPSTTSSSTTTTTITPSTPSSFFTPSLCRHASTSASAPSSTASVAGSISSAPSTASASASASASGPLQSLDWNAFFQLRTSRRRYSLVSSVLGSVATTASTMTTLTAYPSLQDAVMRVITLDPMVSLGLTTCAGMAAGWLVGPFFGNFVWRALHRRSLADFLSKEKGFYERIKKHRVDPRGASANNPVPDYYGEKVGSVQGYRRWLKDQRAFNRKRLGLTT